MRSWAQCQANECGCSPLNVPPLTGGNTPPPPPSTGGTGTIACYGCQNGQIVTNSNTFFNSNMQGGTVCGTSSQNGVTTTWYGDQNDPALANCTGVPTPPPSTGGPTPPGLPTKGKDDVKKEKELNEELTRMKTMWKYRI